MTLAIEAHGLVKRYGKTVALDGIDLELEQARVLGVLGPNGAGKIGRLMARRMRSGTGDGPGICRKWRPVGWKSSVTMAGVR